MKESRIERILVDEIRKAGGRAYKWVSPGNDGVPDRIVILPDRPPIFIELKTESGRLTKRQETQIRRLQRLGQDTRVVKGARGLAQFFCSIGRYEAASRIYARYVE